VGLSLGKKHKGTGWGGRAGKKWHALGMLPKGELCRCGKHKKYPGESVFDLMRLQKRATRRALRRNNADKQKKGKRKSIPVYIHL